MNTLVLLDSNSLINRAFYALPPLTNRQGQHTGAIFGFVNMFLKLIDKYKPDYVVAAFDRKAPTFRKKMYEGYKATRKPMPEELASQLEPLKRLLRAMKVQIAELDGFEADDILGTLSKHSKCRTYIVTGDRDSLQLIDDKTTVLMTKKGISEIVEYDEARLKEDGFTPSQIIDLKSLMGDSSDNIPGVAGIGEGTATKLLAEYGTLDNVYAHIDETKGALNRKLTEGKESAYLSYRLATIDRDCPIETVPESQPFEYEFDKEVKDILLEFEFSKIADRLTYKEGVAPVEAVKAETVGDEAEQRLFVRGRHIRQSARNGSGLQRVSPRDKTARRGQRGAQTLFRRKDVYAPVRALRDKDRGRLRRRYAQGVSLRQQSHV